MRMLCNSLLGAALVIGFTSEIHALSITPSSNELIKAFSSPSQSVIDSQINAFLDPDPTLVYKQNVGGSEVGQFANSYSTSFFNSPSDPSDATISFVSGSYITGDEIYLLVKDGNQNPSAYLFDISGWNGTDSIVLEDFWPGNGAISHVSIYASEVPDGGTTLMLLGIALATLAVARRRDDLSTH